MEMFVSSLGSSSTGLVTKILGQYLVDLVELLIFFHLLWAGHFTFFYFIFLPGKPSCLSFRLVYLVCRIFSVELCNMHILCLDRSLLEQQNAIALK